MSYNHLLRLTSVRQARATARPGNLLPGGLLVIRVLALAVMLLTASCASQGQIRNSSLSTSGSTSSYALIQAQSRERDSRTNFTLALSGGGTRAAAFAYGVLQGLRNTPMSGNQNNSLLDELDAITSVSGGSFTCLLYTSPSPRDRTRSRMPSSA